MEKIIKKNISYVAVAAFAFLVFGGFIARADNASSTATSTASTTTPTSTASSTPPSTPTSTPTSTSSSTATSTITTSITTTATSTPSSTIETASSTASSTTTSTASSSIPLSTSTTTSSSTPASTPTSTSISAPSSTIQTASSTASSTPSSTPATSFTATSTPSSTIQIPSSTTPTNATSTNATSTPSAPSASNNSSGGGGGGGGGGTVIATGNAGAAANVSNVINTNILSSQGFLAFLNLFQPFFGTINLSNLSFLADGQCGACGGSLSATNNSSGTVVNDVTVGANTGANTIVSATGTSTIVTGNAGAAGNVVNIVNSNIVSSNYLLVVLNNFSKMTGDLVLPGKDFFKNFLANGSASISGNLSVTNNNTAAVSNNVSTTANTGNNAVSASGTSTIATGNAAAATNVLNLANSNLTTNDQVFILVRVFGNWNGDVFSTPPGLYWQQTPNGLMLTGNGTQSLLGGSSSTSCCNGSTTIANTNTADVKNNVRVYALTGSNKIGNGDGSGSVATGNAGAVGNVVNIVNTNIVGHNILFALINVFGNWQGNLAFGQPDLWVGAQADVSSNPLVPDSTLTYHVTVRNRGTADATNVQIRTADDQAGIATIIDPGGGTVNGGNSVTWNIPLIPTGGSVQFTYTERLMNPLPFHGQGELTESITATEHETDANPSDNTDLIQFGVVAPAAIGGWQPSQLWLKELNNTTSTIPPGRRVKYRLVVGNQGIGPATGVYVHETLYSPMGAPISSSTWALGSMRPGGEVMVNYEAAFGNRTPSGWYISYSSLEGMDVTGPIQPNKDFVSSSSVYIVNPKDYVISPPPQIVFVPAPSTSTPPLPKVGDNNSNIQINDFPPSAPKPDPNLFSKAKRNTRIATAASSTTPVIPPRTTPPPAVITLKKANLTASIGSVFAGDNASSLQGFLTSTAFVFGSPFMHLW